MTEGATKAPRYDANDVKQAASRRELDILADVAGIPRESLNGKHCTCPKCGGPNDRARMFDGKKGAFLCNKCGKFTDWLAVVQWMRDCNFIGAIALAAEFLGVQPKEGESKPKSPEEVFAAVANSKRITVDALNAYGAVVHGKDVVLPMFDGEGKQCSSFRLRPGSGKGFNEKGKPAGVFLPFAGGDVLRGGAVGRIPQTGETWHVVEGAKDAGALWSLGLLAVGLPTSFMAQKFVGLFRSVDLIFIPDRDRAGLKGAQQSGSRLFQIASSLQIAVLPAEFKEKGGADVRDVLAMQDGEKLLRDAIANAAPWKSAADDALIIDAAITPVSETMAAITTSLLARGHIYNRADQVVVIDNDTPIALLGPQQLAGHLNTITEIVVRGNRGDKFEPLPMKYGNVWLCHPAELGRLPKITVFTRHPVCDEDGIFAAPGFNESTGVYFCGWDVKPSDRKETLDQVLAEFCWKSPADRTNFVAVLLTNFFAKKFIGSKPCLLLNANQPGLGKSILAQICAILRDGGKVKTCSYNPDDVEFEKTLGALVREGAGTPVVDNAKAKGRSAVIDSAVLERSLTDPILCYRLLGQSATIKAENSHQFIITANSAEVSRDLISRSIVVSLHFEGAPEKREFSIPDIEGFVLENRETILGELAGYISRWVAAGRPSAEVATRFNKAGWGRIIGGILLVNGEPDFLCNHEDIAGAMDPTLGQFTELVGIMALDARGTWTAGELVAKAEKNGLFATEFDGRTERGKSTVLGTIATRYLGERFRTDEGEFVFKDVPTRNGKVYQVLDQSTASAESAEPLGSLRNLVEP